MWTRNCLALVTVGFLVGTTSDRACRLGAEEPKPPTTIRADEVGRSVCVLGRLGSPLRSVVSVSGIWVEVTEGPSKPGSTLWFHVVGANGKRFDKPVEFRGLDVEVLAKDGKPIEPAKGEHWELQAYETWPDYGHPSDFLKELGSLPGAPPARGSTRLIGILKQQSAK